MVDHVGLGVHPPCCIPIEYEDLIAVTITKQNITKEHSQPNLLKMHLMQQTPIPPIQTEEESERDNNNDLMNLLTGITVEEQSETIKDNENPCSGKRQFVYYFRIL